MTSYLAVTVADRHVEAVCAKVHAIEAVLKERARQDEKWGSIEDTPHTPTDWISILTEELGEAAQAANNMTWSDGSVEQFVRELVEVAAVAMAALEDLSLQSLQTTGGSE